MPKQLKYDKILDALQKLLETKELSNISVSEIAQTAEIGKGSIYYYFECAIVGQKDYDGVSSATGAASSNNNSKTSCRAKRDFTFHTHGSDLSGLPKFLCGFFKDPAINYKGCTGAGFSSSKVHESSHRFTQAGSCFHY